MLEVVLAVVIGNIVTLTIVGVPLVLIARRSEPDSTIVPRSPFHGDYSSFPEAKAKAERLNGAPFEKGPFVHRMPPDAPA